MKSVGIICEYNPFHNGHLYHLEETKKMFPDAAIILVLSGNFTQHGEVSILNKWEKTELALAYGVDLVVELPFPFATQSADTFAKGSIQILKALGVSALVFGSESNQIEKLKTLAHLQLTSQLYQERIAAYMDQGQNYPTALSKALYEISGESIQTPNDILGISYLREIEKQHASILPYTILRKNDYHGEALEPVLTSATSIRKAIKEQKEIASVVPPLTDKLVQKKTYSLDDYYPFLQYKIIAEGNNLEQFQTVDEGLKTRILNQIKTSASLEELIQKIKTKRYTYHKLKRMMIHILCHFTKEEAKQFQNVSYLRILGFTKLGQAYLNLIKKDCPLPIITNFEKDNPLLQLEYRTTCIYSLVYDQKEKQTLLEQEYKKKPTIK